MGEPNGAPCGNEFQCASGHCFVAGISGGVCSECTEDADCRWGCLPPPFEIGGFATCSDGSLGGGCQSDAACQDPLSCVPVLEIPGIADTDTCSECADDLDCAPEQLCTPTYEPPGGAWTCALAGSLPLGATCSLQTSGDLACASGRCAIADVMGLIEVGVCSECAGDLDCDPDQVCAAPEFSLDGTVTAGQCV